MSATYITEPIAPGDAQSGFRCGVHALDDYFARHAEGNTAQGVGKTFVLRGTEEDPAVLGFYTLSMAEIRAEALSDALATKLPKYPLPVALIGRFAIHAQVQGRGVAGRLLGDALQRVLEAASHVGCLGVVVDAKDQRALEFYAKFGFAEIAQSGWPRRMFVACSVIAGATK